MEITNVELRTRVASALQYHRFKLKGHSCEEYCVLRSGAAV